MGAENGVKSIYMYTLDTNALIYYLKNEAKAVLALNNLLVQNTTLYASSVTELELFSFPAIATDEAKKIDALLNTISIIPPIPA